MVKRCLCYWFGALLMVGLMGCTWFPIDQGDALGTVVSQGVGVIGAQAWHAAGYNGVGVKVAIWDFGFRDYKKLVGVELPPWERLTAKGFNLPVAGLANDDPEEAKHGTAVAEIVYDIAPEAEFYLVAADTEEDMIDALEWLIDQGVDVIVASISVDAWCLDLGRSFFEPTFEKLRENGVLLVVASGNDALSHWQGQFQDLNADGRHDFTATDDSISFEAYEGEYLDLVLRWEDPCQPSTNDYVLILYDDDGYVVAESDYDNALDGPVEELFDEIPYDGTYHLVIEKAPTALAVQLDLVWANGPQLEHAVAAGSVSYFEAAISPSVLTVGSVYWQSLQLEETSSQGPTKDGRIKPDLVAPTCVETVSYSGDPTSDDPEWCGFAGTSAAAPHVAGAAVLVKQAYPNYTPDQLQQFLEGNADDLGAVGKDNVYGAGLVRLPPPP